MNRKAIEYLRDQLKLLYTEKPKTGLGFNMKSWVERTNGLKDKSRHQCETAACLAGWAVDLLHADGTPRKVPLSAERLLKESIWFIPLRARERLGLDERQAKQLFLPAAHSLDNITIQDVVRTLTRLLNNGLVDWRLKGK